MLDFESIQSCGYYLHVYSLSKAMDDFRPLFDHFRLFRTVTSIADDGI